MDYPFGFGGNTAMDIAMLPAVPEPVQLEAPLPPFLIFPFDTMDDKMFQILDLTGDDMSWAPPPALPSSAVLPSPAAPFDSLMALCNTGMIKYIRQVKDNVEKRYNATEVRTCPVIISAHVRSLGIAFDACRIGGLPPDVVSNHIKRGMSTIATLPRLKSLQAHGCEYNEELLGALIHSKARDIRLRGALSDADVAVYGTRHRIADLKLLNIVITGDSARDPGNQAMLGYPNVFGGNNGYGQLFSPPSAPQQIPFISELLSACSNTLETLTLDMQALPTGRRSTFQAQFPQLQRLLIKGPDILNYEALGSLLAPSLRKLQIGIDDMVALHCLKNRAMAMANLQMLVTTGVSIGGAHALDNVLLHAPALNSFASLGPNSDGFNQRVIQCLTQRLSLGEGRHPILNLSLSWDHHGIPRKSLVMLGKVPHVQVLHLKAPGLDWQHSWSVNHKLMRKFLEPMRGSLCRLMFSCDTYNSMPRRSSRCVLHPQCYRQPGPVWYLDGDQGTANVAIESRKWHKHCQRMYKEAREYFESFPALELLHIGQCIFDRIKIGDDESSLELVGDTLHEGGFYDDLRKDFKIDV